MVQTVERPSGVYPRVCGGTMRARRIWPWSAGLSPRVRGNLGCHLAATKFWGSIPACAGEPSAAYRRRVCTTVYPRVCGGT